MEKFKWLLGVLLLALMPVLQSCNDDDGYSVGDFSWDWATVRTTGGGGYYLEGDRWGIITPVSTSIPWYKAVDGERVIAFFNPLYDVKDGVQVKMEGIRDVLTKEVETVRTEEESEEFGNDPIVIYQGDMWLGGNYLNLIFLQDMPAEEKHRISLVQNRMADGEIPGQENGENNDGDGNNEDDEEVIVGEDGYVHLELRYNTYGDVTNRYGWGRVSYNLEKFYPKDNDGEQPAMKGFKVTINSKENGEGRVVILDLDHPVGVPEKANEVHSASSLR